MKKLLLTAATAAVLSMSSALALQQNITVDNAGAFYNTIGIVTEAEYAGLVTHPAANSPEKNLEFLNHMVTHWNGVFDPDLPTPMLNPNLNVPASTDFSNDLTTHTFTLGSGFTGTYDYVVLHYGGGGANTTSTRYYQAFYLAGAEISDLVFVQPVINGNYVGGVSSARFFNPTTENVPEAASTLALLGMAMLGLTGLSRAARK